MKTRIASARPRFPRLYLDMQFTEKGVPIKSTLGAFEVVISFKIADFKI